MLGLSLQQGHPFRVSRRRVNLIGGVVEQGLIQSCLTGDFFIIRILSPEESVAVSTTNFVCGVHGIVD